MSEGSGKTKNGKKNEPEEELVTQIGELIYTDPETNTPILLAFVGTTYFEGSGETAKPSIPDVVDTYGRTCNIWIEVNVSSLESISKTITGNLLLGHPELKGVLVGPEVCKQVEDNYRERIETERGYQLYAYDFVEFCIEQGFIDTVLRFLYCWHLEVFPAERSALTGKEVLECKFLKEAQTKFAFQRPIGFLRERCREPGISELNNKRFYNFYSLINIFRNYLNLSHVPFRCMAKGGNIDADSLYTITLVQSYLLDGTGGDADEDCFRRVSIAIAVPLLEWISDNKNREALEESIKPLDQKEKDALQKFVTRFSEADVPMELEMAFILPKFQDLFPSSNDPLFYVTLPTVGEFIRKNISENPIFLGLSEAGSKNVEKKKRVVPINLTMDSKVTRSFYGKQNLLKVDSGFRLGDTKFKIITIRKLDGKRTEKSNVHQVHKQSLSSDVGFASVNDDNSGAGTKDGKAVHVHLISKTGSPLPEKLNIVVEIADDGSLDEGSIVGSIIKEISISQCEFRSEIVLSMDQTQQENFQSNSGSKSAEKFVETLEQIVKIWKGAIINRVYYSFVIKSIKRTPPNAKYDFVKYRDSDSPFPGELEGKHALNITYVVGEVFGTDRKTPKNSGNAEYRIVGANAEQILLEACELVSSLSRTGPSLTEGRQDD